MDGPAGILAVGTALPRWRWRQEHLGQLYVQEASRDLSPRARMILERVFRHESGIEWRALACEDPRVLVRETADEARRRYERFAPGLAAEALRKALAAAQLPTAEVGALVCCTCTGYLCPGLTSYVAELLRLPEKVRAYDLVGMGCGAALPALDLAVQLACAVAPRVVAVVAVELCSAVARFGDSLDLIISNALFGDGAAAALVSVEAPVRWIGYASRLWPHHRDRLRLVYDEGRLRNCLDREVPRLAAEGARRVCRELIGRQGLTTGEVRHWVVHPGGTRVLEAVERVLGLEPTRLGHSYAVLRRCGNMSSPTVLFALEALLASSPADGWGLILGFGAGFSCYGALVRIEKQPRGGNPAA